MPILVEILRASFFFFDTDFSGDATKTGTKCGCKTVRLQD